MDTVETKGISEEDREKLRDDGFKLEYLGQACWNVSCETWQTDALTDMLDSMNVEWRLV